ncbi:MAG: type II toxin-antitoxin system MqsA family antitoxin [Magnetococcales bacterium]|nr:type II toxin-antitoxin system MqsA family antitoxin [Magnetococcales bacterium]MBF0427831.1 type II toxin-antitoxin system MqsA family antitoxin [Magnetococcales bacterium]MBF0438797.1 type II toxin-antitoxin system MqsA family antitoxin [Magnetococcales bacterium]
MTGKCPFCGHRNMADKQVEYLYRSGERFLVVTDVPCLECEFCGEQYFEAVVLKKIERDFVAIQNTGKKPMKTIMVPVEAYAGL